MASYKGLIVHVDFSKLSETEKGLLFAINITESNPYCLLEEIGTSVYVSNDGETVPLRSETIVPLPEYNDANCILAYYESLTLDTRIDTRIVTSTFYKVAEAIEKHQTFLRSHYIQLQNDFNSLSETEFFDRLCSLIHNAGNTLNDKL